MRITSGGRVELSLLGVFRLQTGSVTMDCTPTAGATDGFVWNQSANGYYAWSLSGTERMRISSDGNLLVGTTSGSILGTRTKFSASGNGTARASLGSINGEGTGAIDTGISINQDGFGGAALLLASRNTSDGTSTASAVYLVNFFFNGNNAPATTFIAGTNFVTFGVSGSQTLTVTNGGGGNVTYAWFGNK
jgi:hypothetical protein